MSKERMQKQKKDTLRCILDKAWEIAIEDGMEAISIRKVAAAMNFAPNNLYNYFENKNALLQCLKKDAYQWAFEVLEKEMSGQKDICSYMECMSRTILHCALKSPQKYIVMTSDLIMDDKEPLDMQLTELAAAKIEEGIAAGEFRQVDAVATAVNFRMIVIAFVRMVSANDSMTIEEADKMFDNLMDILFYGILNEKRQEGDDAK